MSGQPPGDPAGTANAFAAAAAASAAAQLNVPVSEVTSQAFTIAARTGVASAALGTWDAGLARPPRVLVPISVEALVVTPEATVPAAAVLPQLADPASTGGDITSAMPPVPPFSAPVNRAPGVYLHWAAPDGVTSSQTLTPAPATPGADIAASMRPLADRWLVLRIGGGTPRRVRGWVIESERGRRVGLGSWTPTAIPPDDGSSRTPHFPSERLTAMAGGDPAWAAVYDAVEDRFAMHDDLADLDPADAAGPLSYLVCGWWSKDANDPLYVPDLPRFVDTMSTLKWSAPTVAADDAASRGISADRLSSAGFGEGAVAKADVVDAAGTVSRATASFVHPGLSELAGDILLGQPADHPQLSLLHGSVIGVLPGGAAADPIPDPKTVELAVGASATEAFAAIITADVSDPGLHTAKERLVEAFCQGLISRLDAPDGLAALDQASHAAGFKGLPGDSVRTDLLMTGDRLAAGAATVQGNLDALHQATLASDANRANQASGVAAHEKSLRLLTARSFHQVLDDQAVKTASTIAATQPSPQQFTPVPVDVAAEPFADALDPVITLRRLSRSLRHGYDGRLSADGTLACRVSGLEVTRLAGLFDAADVISPLGNGSLPPECDTLLQELVIDDYTYRDEAAAYSAAKTGLPAAAVADRMAAEHALRYDVSELTIMRSGTVGAAAADGTAPSTVTVQSGKDLLRAASLRDGMDASPLATTHWTQPWVPMFLEWTLGLRVDETLTGWRLADTDVDPADGTAGDPGSAGHVLEYSGRTLLTSVAARTFAAQVSAFINDEQARRPAAGVLRKDEESSLAAVAATGITLDALSGALTDLHPQLLGLNWADSNRSHRAADGTPILPAPVAAPVLIRAGAAWFTRLCVIDAFGRFIDLPPSSVAPSATLQSLPPADPALAPPAQLLLRPRITRPGRMLLDFVDAAAPDGAEPAAAMVNQSDPAGTISPVCGWLLPDHFDGALEVYDAAADQLGMLLEDVSGAVVWEGAPGQPGPAGAPPSALQPTDTAARHVVRMSAGLVAADAQRRADPAAATEESALSALLRAIDTTAWTVDPFGSLGTEHHSVLVGRPIAVMRMQLQIQVESDLGTGSEAELNLDAEARAIRQAAYDLLSSRQITVRLGELTRTDDGVLGYFVDDDYSRFTPVSPEVLAQARASGRLTGQLGVLGPGTAGPPGIVPVTHPYVDDSETPLQARPGQTVRLTVLMAPGGSAHATCGLFPRVSTSLSREWIAPALKRLMPTFRVGPVLVDPAAVRVPKTTGLPKEQVFTARPDPASWRDDPISAATQDALLPTAPAVVREGYLRVTLPDTTAAASP